MNKYVGVFPPALMEEAAKHIVKVVLLRISIHERLTRNRKRRQKNII
ncbi:MAG: hypothetical protein ACYSO7_10220 [Planctomycetota bacterium]